MRGVQESGPIPKGVRVARELSQFTRGAQNRVITSGQA